MMRMSPLRNSFRPKPWDSSASKISLKGTAYEEVASICFPCFSAQAYQSAKTARPAIPFWATSNDVSYSSGKSLFPVLLTLHAVRHRRRCKFLCRAAHVVQLECIRHHSRISPHCETYGFVLVCIMPETVPLRTALRVEGPLMHRTMVIRY